MCFLLLSRFVFMLMFPRVSVFLLSCVHVFLLFRLSVILFSDVFVLRSSGLCLPLCLLHVFSSS